MEDFYQLFVYYILPILLALGYYLYYRKFSFFKIHEKMDSYNLRNKLPRGKCPPSYPNGWYMIAKSRDLKVG